MYARGDGASRGYLDNNPISSLQHTGFLIKMILGPTHDILYGIVRRCCSLLPLLPLLFFFFFLEMYLQKLYAKPLHNMVVTAKWPKSYIRNAKKKKDFQSHK